jgi:hypothetical protein
MTQTRPGYSTHDVARLSGLSFRRLDYWVRRKAIAPSLADAEGSGSRRRWSDDDLARLRSIADVATVLEQFGTRDIPADLVGRLWREMENGPVVFADSGAVRFVVTMAAPA